MAVAAIDWLALTVVTASLLLGAWRGLLYEVLALAGWVLAFLAARWAAPLVGQWLPMGESPEPLRHAVGGRRTRQDVSRPSAGGGNAPAMKSHRAVHPVAVMVQSDASLCYSVMSTLGFISTTGSLRSCSRPFIALRTCGQLRSPTTSLMIDSAA